MDWKNAKNIILVSLILVNVFLFVLHSNTDVKYELTNNQIQNIKTVLAENNIAIYSLIPDKYEPMPELELRNDTLNLSVKNFSSFIDVNEEVIPVTQDKKNIYLVDTTRILIDEDQFIVDTTDNKELAKIEIDTITYLNNLVTDMGDKFKNYKLDAEIVSNNNIKYEFREMYEDEKIYDNYIQFTVIDNYLYKIQGKHLENVGFTSTPQQIISADIALFTFMSVLRENQIYETDEIFINNIDMVYYKNYENNVNQDVQSICIPAYRIYTEQGELPFIINAYTNKLMNY